MYISTSKDKYRITQPAISYARSNVIQDSEKRILSELRKTLPRKVRNIDIEFYQY